MHGEKLNCKGAEGKEARQLVKAATEMIDQLDGSGSKVPWRKLAARDHILAIGLTWATGP